jgi:hypothetical protein
MSKSESPDTNEIDTAIAKAIGCDSGALASILKQVVQAQGSTMASAEKLRISTKAATFNDQLHAYDIGKRVQELLRRKA